MMPKNEWIQMKLTVHGSTVALISRDWYLLVGYTKIILELKMTFETGFIYSKGRCPVSMSARGTDFNLWYTGRSS